MATRASHTVCGDRGRTSGGAGSSVCLERNQSFGGAHFTPGLCGTAEALLFRFAVRLWMRGNNPTSRKRDLGHPAFPSNSPSGEVYEFPAVSQAQAPDQLPDPLSVISVSGRQRTASEDELTR